MSQISIIGDEGQPVQYASMTREGKLFFDFNFSNHLLDHVRHTLADHLISFCR
jgi:hypothetical protein